MLIALPLAALIAGLAGTWSPCGLSAIDSLRPAAHGRGAATTTAALGAFAAGALVGGAVTFTALGALGRLLGGAHVGGVRVGLAIALAAAGALADLRGLPVRPQIRRQVPEPWRRRWPLPAAAGAYGVLLGLGFTTYVLAFVLWTAAALTLALGSPELGVAAGLAFGVGRALPVVALAPVAERPGAAWLLAAMAERPAILRAVRRAGGVALLACAAALAVAPGAAQATGRPGARDTAAPLTALPPRAPRAGAARLVAAPATDPSVDGALLVWQTPTGAVLRLPSGTVIAGPGQSPAVGDGLIAYLDGGLAHVVSLATGAAIVTVPAPGADALAVASRWLVMRRTVSAQREVIQATPLDRVAPPRTVAASRLPGSLGRPSLDGKRLVWAHSTVRTSVITELNLETGRSRTPLRANSGAAYAEPSLHHAWLLYVREGRCTQQLRLRSLAHPRRDTALLTRGPLGLRDAGYEPGHTSQGSGPSRCGHRQRASAMVWATALSEQDAYVTLVAVRANGSLGAGRVVALLR